ncbi:MAG: DUF6600 domain-containing protein [Pseudomonadota bacterium]
MPIRFPQAAALLALALFSTLAQADNDAPSRAGRVSLVQGNVSVSADVGYQAEAALLNLPVTSHNQFTTARDARTEFHVGSTAVRLDADSSLEVTQLDDENLIMRLNYGSVSVRVRNADNLRGFELDTQQGRVRLQEPGRVRIDAERMPDTSTVSVFDGAAVVDAGGATLTVRAGKRVEVHNDDVHTGLAARDSFDEWVTQRDQYDQRATSARYVPQEMTGYEELEQNGYWRESAEYGAIWMPRNVPVDWAPYRDGRWTWVSPWGWTWVDNAPWGYAPFHYGRWVVIERHWYWAPGRYVGRPVWAPALVGWVGGNNWQVSFSSGGISRAAPAQGWYPLRPHEAYVPTYRVSNDHLRQINLHAREERRHEHEHERDWRREGLTVVPHEQFTHRGLVEVRNAPRPAAGPLVMNSVQPVAPPTPQAPPAGRGNEPRRERDERYHGGRPERQAVQASAPAVTAAPPAVVAAPTVATTPPPRQPAEEARHQRRPEPASAAGVSTPVQARAIPDEPRQARRAAPEAPPPAAAAPVQPPPPPSPAHMPVHEAAREGAREAARSTPAPVREVPRAAPREAAAPAPAARASAEAQKESRGRKDDERKEEKH